jgi:phosphoribosyl 1,2-cyclic phosphodiesterase
MPLTEVPREEPGGFLVRIWGARGSLPPPAAENCTFGSDTCCVEMRCGPHVLIFDAGTGAGQLGLALQKEGVCDFDLYFSHCHFDHIAGLPFIKPLYDAAVTARLHAGHFLDATTCREMADLFMGPPFFPVTPQQFRAAIDYRDFRPPDRLSPHPGLEIATHRLNHPNGAVGYRVAWGGRAACYVTDVEHDPDKPDAALIEFIAGADVLIYDCSYTDAEFATARGYGHSTWEEGVRLCRAAGVARLVIFHHRPGRDDAALALIEAEAQAVFPGAMVARTGLEIAVSGEQGTE